jgi:hypothetical protein
MIKRKLCINCIKYHNEFVQIKEQTKEMREILAKKQMVGDDSFAYGAGRKTGGTF